MDRADRPASAPPPSRATLVDVLDRVLEAGAVLSGDLTLAVADIDLVRVSLRALVAAVETTERLAGEGRSSSPNSEERSLPADRPAGNGEARPPGPPRRPAPREPPLRGFRADPPGSVEPPGTAIDGPVPAHRLDTDPRRVERGLAQLVMTVVGLLKDLMERQATRRVEAGSLTEEEVEWLGTTFTRLEQRFAEILEELELRDEDLTIDLGPLGRLR